MTKKELLDKIWEKVAEEKERHLNDCDHFANIGDFLDSKKSFASYKALNIIRDFLYELYRDPELYK